MSWTAVQNTRHERDKQNINT